MTLYLPEPLLAQDQSWHEQIDLIAESDLESNEISEHINNLNPERKISIDFELDPYYTSMGLIWRWSGERLYDAGDDKEENLLLLFLKKSLWPGLLLLEVSVNPMPAGGGLFKKYEPELYGRAKISAGFNMVESLTTGFEEPYAVSLFLGNIITFTEIQNPTQKNNRAYLGFLVNVGNYHIKNNEFIQDQWLEAEWKIKASREFMDHRAYWHFRIGSKIHQNPEITDVAYFAITRGRLDYDAPWYNLLAGSGIEYRLDLSLKDASFVRQSLVLEKKIHVFDSVETSLKMGFIWQANKKYTGSLASSEDEWKFVIYPGFTF